MLDHDLLEEYRDVAANMRELKKRELVLRNEICDKLLEGRNIGTHNFSMEGFSVKAVKKVSYSLDQEMVAHYLAEDELNEYEIEMIRTKYELGIKNFKAGADHIGVLEDAITVKPSLPTLTIELGE